jgi:hypothetical protein
MTYTTLSYQGTEKTLADWGISTWSRTAQNQAQDGFDFSMPAPMDGNDVFPYGAQVIIRINRAASRLNPINPTLPASLNDGGGALGFSGGRQWFWGYCIDNERRGEAGAETFNYRFVGPYPFFFERLIFQKLMLTWNGTRQVLDYQSDVVLGVSIPALTGAGDTIAGTVSTNLMSIAQQVKEICLYAQADSAYQQANNGLGWPGGAQFQCDALTNEIDGVNWDLLQTPSANVLINDYAAGALGGETSASTLPAGSCMLRAPLDTVNAITCAEAMRRQLQWLGGMGSPVVWTDHSQTPPQLHVATRDRLTAVTLPLSGIAVKNKIKRRTDLIPAAVHFKYKVSGSFLGQPWNVVINDVASYVSGTLVEGIGQIGALTDLSGNALSSGIQSALMAAAKTATAVVQTFDFQGLKVSGATATVTTQALNLGDPAAGGAALAFWQSLFPELASASNVRFFDAVNCPVTVVNAATGSAIDTTVFINQLVDGQAAPWMPAHNSTSSSYVAGQTVKAKVTAYFAYTENAQGRNAVANPTVGYKEHHCTLTLTTVAGGTYSSASSATAGEPLPYGLAGYICALETIPQYEGSIVAQESEISDVCPMGSALNISGGRAEWSNMLACAQDVRYSDNGQTEITFGPAKHLGPAQFIARFRNNMGPRWYNLISGDPMNTTSAGGTPAQLGNNLPAEAPSPGAKLFTFQSFFTSLSGDQSATPATLAAGVHVDSGAAGNPFTGATPSGTRGFGPGQGITLAAGPGAISGIAAGEANPWIRLHLHDLVGGAGALANLHVYLRELQTCEPGTGGNPPTTAYRLFLCSEPYTSSLGV